MSTPRPPGFHARSRDRAGASCRTSSQRRRRGASLPPGLALALFAATTPVFAQDSEPAPQGPHQLETTTVRRPEPKGPTRRTGQSAPQIVAVPPSQPTADVQPLSTQTGGGAQPPATPLNSNVIATVSNRLGLTVHETPATVEVVSRQQMQEQGYRTTTETAQGAVGVQAADVGGAPATFDIRGFTFGQVNVLYNGISVGPADITSWVMDTANLEQVEFLKGPSSLMTGLNAIGGAVNFVSRQPTTGVIRNELDTSIDAVLGTYRSHFGSGGSSTVPGLDYRFDVSSSKINSFIDGDYQKLNNASGQLNYHLNDSFMVFSAFDYLRDDGHAYWGTPLVPLAFSGPYAITGVVSGFAVNTFNGTLLGPLGIDSRTITTNYNIADNSTGSQALWLRGGFEWALNDEVTIRDQAYQFGARRHWIDSETYAFDLATSTIDRDRFFVTHKQEVFGNNLDLNWNTTFYGMENRFATQLQASRNDIKFVEEGNFDVVFPFDTVSVVNPAPGTYGVMSPDVRNSRLDTVALAVEDRLKITPWFALIGGIRVDDFTLSRNGINFDGTIPAGQPFTKNWEPVSYRAAATFEPVKGMMFYGMTATAYDPAAAGIFSVTPGTSLELTSARLYETGIKMLSNDNRAEFTFSAYDIVRQNVFVQLTNAVATLAGEVHTKGVELAAAVRPIEHLKLWGNAAFTDSKYGNFDVWTGNTPSNVAPVIINAGASYRFDNWRWPLEIGGSVRHVGQRFVFEDDLTAMLPYTTADLFAFVDIPGRDLWWPGLQTMRVTFRVRNLTNALYAQFSDPGLPDQVLLGAPRTFELAASAKW